MKSTEPRHAQLAPSESETAQVDFAKSNENTIVSVAAPNEQRENKRKEKITLQKIEATPKQISNRLSTSKFLQQKWKNDFIL
jgi:hypothetical protein